MADIATPGTNERVLTGIALVTFAYFLFSSQDAIIKLLVETVTVWQVMFFRSLAVLVGCVAFSGRSVIVESARSPILYAILGRSALILAAWLCFYSAAKYMQLAELTTIYFAAPVIVTVLSIVMLGEKVPLLRWVAVLLGFAGVFVACNPTRLGLSWPVLLVLAAAVLWSLSIVLIRKLALMEKTIVQIAINNAFFLAVSAVPVVLDWTMPSTPQLVMLLSVGILGGVGQYALYEGMKHADASIVTGFEYTALIWAFLFGYLIWADIPRPEVFVGAALISVAGVVLLASERSRLRARA